MKPTNREEGFLSDETNGAFLYDPLSKEFKLVSQSIWDTAEGEIKNCSGNLLNSAPGYKTYGWYPLVSLMDSKGERVAVISAAGPKTPAIFSFPTGQATGRILGTRYFEVFYRQGDKAKGSVVRLSGLDESYPLMCWTPDENFIVIYDNYFYNLFVVDSSDIERNN
jgi:hypothetical protein